MAKAPQKKDKKPKAPKDPLATLRLLKIAGYILCGLAAVVLFGSLYDLGFIDLRFELRDYALVAFAALIAGFGLAAFSGSGVERAERSRLAQQIENITGEVAEKNAGLETSISMRIAAVEEKVQTFLGDEYERIKAENEEFRKEIEQHRFAEMTRTNTEIEQLRERNEMLQEKINKWAINSVDSAVMNERIHEA